MKRLHIYILIVLCLSNFKVVWANNGAGAELIYEYVNDSTYRFWYKFYTACGAFPEANDVSLCYRNSCANIWYTERIAKASLTPWGTPNGQMVVLPCGDQPTRCTDPASTLNMYREWWYTGLVTLNQRCDTWTFSVNRERTQDISNVLIMPILEHNIYVEATINTLTERRQSSPYFTSPLPVYACAGSPFNYNLGVVDPDGDSLVFKTIIPRTATWDITVVCAGYPPSNMTYSGMQYNINNNPLDANNTYNLNSATGDVSFTPAGNQVAFLAFLVEKYRNGKLIGTVMRDSRLEVRDCNAPPVQFEFDRSSITGGNMRGDTLYVCGNTQVDFCFSAQTTTSGASLVLSDNSNITLKGAEVTYQNQGTSNVEGCLSWKPMPGDFGFRYLIISVKDSTCSASSYPVVQTYKIPVYVNPGTVGAAKDTLICPGSSTLLMAYGGNSFNWSVHPDDTSSSITCSTCDTAIVSPTAHSTRYILTSDLKNGCAATDTVTIRVDYSNNISIDPPGPIVLCDGGSYVLLSSKPSGPKPLKEVACGPYSSTCNGNLDSAQIAEQSNNSYSSDIFYNYNSYYGPFNQANQTQKMQIVYRKEELQATGMKPGSLQKVAINFAPFTGTSPTFHNVTIAIRCTDKFQFTAPFQSEFEIGLTEVFSAASVTLTPGWNEFEFDIPYDYDTSKNIVLQFCYNSVNPRKPLTGPGMVPVYYVTTSYRSSIEAGQSEVGNACAGNLGIVRLHNRRPDTRFVFCEMPEDDFKFSWTPSTGMDDPGAAETGVFVDKSTWFTVSTKGKNGCEVKDSIFVYVADNDFSVEPEYAEICFGEATVFNVHDAHKSVWYDDNFNVPQGFSCTDCNSPTVSPDETGLFPYIIVASDSFGCADTLEAALLVKPKPETKILNNDTTIQYGESIQLFAQGAYSYIWSPVSNINDPRSSSPWVSPKEKTLYVVTGFLPDGCSNSDSVWVNVDIHGKLLIPSAFTPNGDGLNDIFKIENLSFQKVNVFQVYNRFGQVMYDGADNSNKGWNGMYNGKEAAAGVYYYLIKINYPDGRSETHKGDLTLIR